jgi:hypothetical protein
VEDDFLVDFVAESSNKLQKLGLEGNVPHLGQQHKPH